MVDASYIKCSKSSLAMSVKSTYGAGDGVVHGTKMADRTSVSAGSWRSHEIVGTNFVDQCFVFRATICLFFFGRMRLTCSL